MAKVSVVVRGNLGRDVETKVSKAGKTYYSLSVGSTPSKRTAEGGYEDGETMWFNVLAFEEMNPFEFTKGASVEVEGTLTANLFAKRDGSTGLALDVLASSVKRVEREPSKKAEIPAQSNSVIPTSWTPIEEDVPF